MIVSKYFTSSPHTLGRVRIFPTEDGLVPGAKQVTNFDSITVIHVTMDNVLLGAPVACLNREEGGKVIITGAR